VSLFVIQEKSRRYALPFRCPTENAPFEFIYGLKGTADIRLAAREKISSYRLGGGACLSAYLPGAEGELSFHAGAALSAVVLQVQARFLLKLLACGGSHLFGFQRNRPNHAQQSRIKATSLPFALHILLQQIYGYNADGAWEDIFFSSKKYEMLYKQLDLNATPSSRPSAISRTEYLAAHRVYEWLRAHIAHPPNLEDLAASSGLSRSRLTSLFRSLFGDTVFGVLRRERLACACQMLDEFPEKNLTEISYLCGFSSSAHFTKSFSAHYGVTPKEYRHCYRQP
jgi:AraC-like DNA-binding protein